MFTLTEQQRKGLEVMGRSYRLRFVILHGSYAAGKERPGSDLDIALVGEKGISFDKSLAIYGTLDDILGDRKERELDVKTLHKADPLFRYLVVRDGILLYGDITDYNEFKAYAFRDYMDSSDLRELELTLLKKSISAIEARYAR